MLRGLILIYSIVAYVVFLASFLYAIGFVGGFIVPKGIDCCTTTAGDSTSFAINLGLLSLFAIQHSVMARPSFKRWWTRIIPPAAERSTYVLASSLLLALLFWQWQPLPETIWNTSNRALVALLRIIFAMGWLVVLLSTFLINHFELFGLRQAYQYFTSQSATPLPFRTPWFYQIVRHPIMLGFLIAFWSTPTMSQGHLLFAAVVTVYVLIAIRLEERDLLAHFGEAYAAYQRRVAMLLPLPKSDA